MAGGKARDHAAFRVPHARGLGRYPPQIRGDHGRRHADKRAAERHHPRHVLRHVMIAPIPFEPSRFRSAAEHYQAGRAPYPASLIQRVAATVGLRPTHRMLDLGCGPGPLAIAFAPLVSEVVALDPEPAMLEAGRVVAVDCPNIRFVQGSSYDLVSDFGRFFLVTMGRSFHWMDRVDTLHRLDGMIEPGGAIALFNDSQPDVPDNAWRQDYDAVLARYAE